ncbi:MAG: FG-GAP-like repeat-containing protein, partial [Candidatus Zixiibacteriota bacterium]
VVARPAQVFGADLNGDGYPDLVVGNSQAQNIALLINKGGEDPDSAGKFHLPTSIVVNGAQPTSLWAGPINDDSYNDIVVSFYGSNSMSVLFNDPQNPGNFHTSAQFPLGYVPQFIMGADLDNKNGNDIVALNEGYPPAPGDLYVFFNDGQGNFSQYNRIFLTEPTEYDPFAIGMFCADLDGDGDLDIAVVNFSAGKVSILLNSEEIRGDVNNSGYIDVIDAVYLLNYLFRKGPEPYSQESGDLNCDGRLSISDVIFSLKYIFKSLSPTPCCLCE